MLPQLTCLELVDLELHGAGTSALASGLSQLTGLEVRRRLATYARQRECLAFCRWSGSKALQCAELVTRVVLLRSSTPQSVIQFTCLWCSR